MVAYEDLKGKLDNMVSHCETTKILALSAYGCDDIKNLKTSTAIKNQGGSKCSEAMLKC